MKNRPKKETICWKNKKYDDGSPGRIRTSDQVVNSHLLYHWATEEHPFHPITKRTAKLVGLPKKTGFFTWFFHPLWFKTAPYQRKSRPSMPYPEQTLPIDCKNAPRCAPLPSSRILILLHIIGIIRLISGSIIIRIIGGFLTVPRIVFCLLPIFACINTVAIKLKIVHPEPI